MDLAILKLITAKFGFLIFLGCLATLQHTRTVYSNGGHSMRNLVILRTTLVSLKMKSEDGPVRCLGSLAALARRGMEAVLPTSPVPPAVADTTDNSRDMRAAAAADSGTVNLQNNNNYH